MDYDFSATGAERKRIVLIPKAVVDVIVVDCRMQEAEKECAPLFCVAATVRCSSMKEVVKQFVVSGRQNILMCCNSVMLNHEKTCQAASGEWPPGQFLTECTSSTVKENLRQLIACRTVSMPNAHSVTDMQGWGSNREELCF